MSFHIHLSGHVKKVVDDTVPVLAADLVASGITACDPTLWGPEAEAEAAVRLGQPEPGPVERDQLGPQRIAVRLPLVDGAHQRRGTGRLEDLPRVLAQLELVLRELEIHQWRVVASRPRNARWRIVTIESIASLRFRKRSVYTL